MHSKAYTSPGALVLDKVGYLTYRPDAANVLFHVVNDRYIARRPIIFTTNKSQFSEWSDALHDKDLAEAAVDLVLEKGRLILLDGTSERTQHIVQPEAQVKVDKPVRISGIYT